MGKNGWSSRVVLRYALIQLPFAALLVVVLIMVRRWVDLPIWLVGAIVVLWVIKEIVLFPFVWRSYDPERPARSGSIEGARGIAVDDLHPSGYVEIGAELWKAEVVGGAAPIKRGEHVRVSGIRGLTLLVKPDREN
jgi:membrane protein implicated in regulation of membrane protease activity